MKKITDPAFRYLRREKTDLRKTFARIRKEMQEQARVTNVQQLPKRKGN